MELRNENPITGSSNENQNDEGFHTKGEVFIEKERKDEAVEVEDETDTDIESWGVYLQGKDKTMLGLFWDYKLAELFLDTVKKSDVLKKVKEMV